MNLRKDDMRFVKIILSIYCILLACTAYAGGGNTWTNFQGDNNHTGFANVIVNPSGLRILWTRSMAYPTDLYAWIGNLIVTEQGIYFIVRHISPKTFDFWKLVALNPKTGETQWEIDTNEGTSPAYDDGKLYTLTKVTNAAIQRQSALSLNAYDHKTGRVLFSNQIVFPGDRWYEQTPVVDNHQIFIGSSYTQFGLNADTGKIIWKSGDVEGYEYTASVSSRYVMRLLYNALAVLDRQTGELVASIGAVDNPIYQSATYPVVFDEKTQTAFTMFYSKNTSIVDSIIELTAFDIENKKIRWQKPLFSRESNFAIADDTLFFIESSFQFNKNQYDQKQRVLAINTRNGEVMWNWEPMQKLNGQIIVTPNVLIIGAEKLIYIVSRESHQLVAMIPVSYTDKMAVAGNVLYVANVNETSINPSSITAIQLN
jgi:outer membrane protein assembly factor BamB